MHDCAHVCVLLCVCVCWRPNGTAAKQIKLDNFYSFGWQFYLWYPVVKVDIRKNEVTLTAHIKLTLMCMYWVSHSRIHLTVEELSTCFQTNFVQGERTTPTIEQLTKNTICRPYLKMFDNCCYLIVCQLLLEYPPLLFVW